MKTILVTGGAGFIGSHVVDALVGRGERCVVVDDLSTGDMSNVSDGAIYWETDLCIRDLWWSAGIELRAAFNSRHPEVVVHFAANPSVSRSTWDEIGDLSANVIGTINAIRIAEKTGCKHFIFASTCAVYGNAGGPVSESETTNPISPYGISKLAAEHYVEYYSRTYGMPATILRFSNVYGPRQRPEAGVVAAFCDKMLRGESVTIYGDGSAVRDYLYVDDAVSAVLAAMDRPGDGCRVLNIGSGVDVSLKFLMAIAHRAARIDDRQICYKPSRCGDVQCIFLDRDRAAAQLGWRPYVRLEDGLRRTVEWHASRQREPQTA